MPGANVAECRKCAFRVHTNAAPLKPGPGHSSVGERAVFPRSHERGPIEAYLHLLNFALIFFFPRSHERGPIEARDFVSDELPDSSFPRSHERGPIEAVPLGTLLVASAFFPRSHERGPIEAPRLGLARETSPALSAFTRTRPH